MKLQGKYSKIYIFILGFMMQGFEVHSGPVVSKVCNFVVNSHDACNQYFDDYSKKALILVVSVTAAYQGGCYAATKKVHASHFYQNQTQLTGQSMQKQNSINKLQITPEFLEKINLIYTKMPILEVIPGMERADVNQWSKEQSLKQLIPKNKHFKNVRKLPSVRYSDKYDFKPVETIK